MTRTVTAAVALAVAIGWYQAAANANSSPMPAGPSMSSPAPTRSPAAMAREAYNNGIEHRDKGNKLEDQAAAQQPKDRDKTLTKAHDEFGKALKDFKKASDLDPTLYQAFNGMGYAYRKTGEAAKALEMYDAALAMAPGFPDAIEYRGEAYLALNRVNDAKLSYLTLFASDREQATQLLKAMTAWVKARQADPSGVDAAVISGLETWIKERAAMATTTVAMARTGHKSIWN